MCVCETLGGHRAGNLSQGDDILPKQCIHQEQSPVLVWDETGLERFRGIKEERKERLSVFQGRRELPHPGGAGISVLASP